MYRLGMGTLFIQWDLWYGDFVTHGMLKMEFSNILMKMKRPISLSYDHLISKMLQTENIVRKRQKNQEYRLLLMRRCIGTTGVVCNLNVIVSMTVVKFLYWVQHEYFPSLLRQSMHQNNVIYLFILLRSLDEEGLHFVVEHGRHRKHKHFLNEKCFLAYFLNIIMYIFRLQKVKIIDVYESFNISLTIDILLYTAWICRDIEYRPRSDYYEVLLFYQVYLDFLV